MTTFGAAPRRLIALSLLLLLCAAAWQLAIMPLRKATTAAWEELRESRFLLKRLTRIAEENSGASEAALAQVAQLKTAVFAAETSTEADSLFMAAVDQCLREAQVRLIQLNAGTSTRIGPLTRLTATLVAEGSEADVSALLLAIERHRPVLIIEAATLRSMEGGQAEHPSLSVNLQLLGLAAALKGGR